MSGYLEVKYPLKSNLGLNPFKSWKRQWCILRPSPTSSGGCLAVYCSEAGAAAGAVELPAGCVVRRAKSRTRPYAFAVFGTEDNKPRVLLAASTLHDANLWMDKIRTLLFEDKSLESESVLKDCYSVSVAPTELSRKCGVHGDGVASLSARGVRLQPRALRPAALLPWRHIAAVALRTDPADNHKTCVLTIDRFVPSHPCIPHETRLNFSQCLAYPSGGGELKLWCGLAGQLAAAVAQARRAALQDRPDGAVLPPRAHNLSKSDGDLRSTSHSDLGEIRRSSWYSGPSEVSLDDIDLIMSKEAKRIPSGQLSRCSGAGDLAPAAGRGPQVKALQAATSEDSTSDRRSLASVASGIYEEIPDLPEGGEAVYCAMGLPRPRNGPVEEPTYESVADCVYATMRRTGKRFPPPPLPPRLPFGTMKLGESWNSRMNSSGDGDDDCAVTRHGSLGSLPRCCSLSSGSSAASSATLPGKAKPAFSVFRKRLKSDSRVTGSPKSDVSKENKDVETKKKKFEFAPTRDMFRNFKMGRKAKGAKAGGALGQGETKSCEFLDGGPPASCGRCARSEERLDDDDLAVAFDDDAAAALALPQEIVALILRARRPAPAPAPPAPAAEGHYLPMSPLSPPLPLPEHHYIAMSPRVRLA
ncbi:uncharacterized protein LOC113230801 [Hyposmocoma kahamanoa]|uniref:uncharacterized protein LOC113230801 n=1 Tax=Hyposmocoma kahamanoa TaxID=1477025 RepID=UPI000E6DA3A9|nr:uncharacterized protein LOC113230801 [Hyposmocoma kahamanoa]